MARCEVHKHVEAVGYCRGCGTFGCDECLAAADEKGHRYCGACAEAMGLEAAALAPSRPTHLHSRYVVRYKDGRCLFGTFYAMDLDGEGFNFVAFGAHGGGRERRVFVRFADLKAVFQVREFRGNKQHPPRYRTPNPSDPQEAAVCFSDGEVVRGRLTGGRGPSDRRFHLIPRDSDDNNEMLIVEASAVTRIEVHGLQKARELRDLTNSAIRKRLLVYFWRHRGRTVTVADIARRTGRVESAIAENLTPYVEHGLIERRQAEGGEVLDFKDPTEPATREFLKNTYDELIRFYFRGDQRAQTEARAL